MNGMGHRPDCCRQRRVGPLLRPGGSVSERKLTFSMVTSQIFPRVIGRRHRSMGGHRVGILAAMLVACLPAPPSHAESPTGQSSEPPLQPSVQGLAMPQQERDLIAILADAQTQAHRTRSTKDTRLAMQIRVTDFLRKDAQAKNWIGVVKDIGKTADGERWISIVISPDITISTCRDRSCDPNDLTLIRPTSTLFQAIDGIAINDHVIFSAYIIGGLLTGDTAMIEVPEMIARFDAIKVRQ
jgi:hypothetical protein